MLSGVSKTAVLTLRARAEEQARPDRIFSDPLAAEWYAQLEWPSELDSWYRSDVQAALAFRADDIDQVLTLCFQEEGKKGVVELGAGLSTRRQRLSALPLPHWTDVDLPEIVALRRRWGVEDGQIAASVLDFAWMDQVPGPPSEQFFIAEGLLYYLPRAEVDRLLATLRARFPGSLILFDVVGRADYPKTLETTSAVGAPVQWKLEGDFEEALADLGLAPVSFLSQEALFKNALDRYWHRFDQRTRGMFYFAMSSPLIWGARSGMVFGRL